MGGNLLIAHGGGPTAVINASLAGVVEQALEEPAVDSIYGARHGIEGVLAADLIDLGAQPREIWNGIRRTPASAVGSCRRKLSAEDLERIVEVFRAYGVRYFLYNGGNDSMDNAHKVAGLARDASFELFVVGIPKTVDNDLPETDHCPGYGSAARFFAQVTHDLGRDLEALPTPVSVMEVMGRNAGWLAAATVLGRASEADAPHLVCLPERPFEMERFLDHVQRVYDRLGRVVIAASEGIRDVDGNPVYESGGEAARDGFGHALPGNAGQFLAGSITEKLKLRARSEKPGLVGRAAMYLISDVDQQEAYDLGKAAVRAAADGVSGRMMTLVRESDAPYRCAIGATDLANVANVEHMMPDEFIGEDGVSVTGALETYARPLIGEAVRSYPRLADIRVPKRI